MDPKTIMYTIPASYQHDHKSLAAGYWTFRPKTFHSMDGRLRFKPYINEL